MTAAGELKPHPTNPHGVLVPCANCGHEIHAPRDDFTEGGIDPANLTCSYDCMVANQRKVMKMTKTKSREQLAVEAAKATYESDEVTINGGTLFLTEDTEATVESVDGGYWVAARVWVEAWDVEDRFNAEQS